MNNEEITANEWVEFGNSKFGRKLLDNMKALRDANLEQAMDIPDKTVMPNESIAAYMNRAKGIQIMMDDILAKIENAKNSLKGGKPQRD